MKNIESIAVFCGSSEGNDPKIIEQAQLLGRTMAEQNKTLVYGGSKIGIMGHVAKSVLDNHGNVIGVIPEFLKLKEVVHLGLTQLFTTQNMHERKLKMHDLADAFITLPGGFGTLEELFEIITWSQLGLHQKPIGLLNCNGFYNDLINMLETMVANGFLKINSMELLIVDSTIEGLLKKMADFKPEQRPHFLKPERT